MILKSFGCSFIYGSDLSDCPHGMGENHPGPSQSSWPALIAQKKNMGYKCQAWPGTGNLSIMEKVMYESTRPEPSFYVISWTWIDRFDYVWSYNRPRKYYSWKSVMPNDPTEFSKNYFSEYHSQVKDQFTNVVYINQIIQILKNKQIPFVMTYQDDLILDHSHDHPGLREIQDLIKPHLFLFQDKTFLEWSRDRDYPISDNWHPLEEAHSAAAEYVLNHCPDLL